MACGPPATIPQRFVNYFMAEKHPASALKSTLAGFYFGIFRSHSKCLIVWPMFYFVSLVKFVTVFHYTFPSVRHYDVFIDILSIADLLV
jgi:hypothetical protein